MVFTMILAKTGIAGYRVNRTLFGPHGAGAIGVDRRGGVELNNADLLQVHALAFGVPGVGR